MSHKAWIVVVLVAFVAAIGAGLLISSHPVAPEAEYPEPVEVKDLSGTVLYASGEYGFTMMYPESARLEEAFSPDYHLGTLWRANAGPDEEGTPVLAVIAYEKESNDSYPRYYRAMVRVGVSEDPGAVARCEEADTSVGEEKIGSVLMNGPEWHTFAFQDAGMMQYVKGVSYRTVHDGRCYAVEQIAAGSSYREEPSEKDIPEEVLLDAYSALVPIIRSFTFVSP